MRTGIAHKSYGGAHQLIQVDVLFGDTLANSKHLILAVNFLGGFTRPLFAVASGSSGAWIEMIPLTRIPGLAQVASGSSGAWIEISKDLMVTNLTTRVASGSLGAWIEI